MTKFLEEMKLSLTQKGYNIEDFTEVLNYYKSREDLVMYCPLCKNTLTSGEWFTYDDICGDSQSPKYSCGNKDCELHNKSFWNDSGEFFSGVLDYDETKKLFPDERFAALNSISKNSEVEIYKRGLKDKTMLPSFLCLGILKPYIEYAYKADMMGNVLKRGFVIKFLKKDDKGNFCYGWTSDWSMYKYMLRQFKNDRDAFNRDPNHKNKKDLLEYFIPPYWDKRFYRKVLAIYFKLFYTKTLSKLK
jgi:hypothetical protein